MVTSSQAMLVAPRSICFETRELARLRADWARVRFHYCGLCGSDVSKFEGRRDISYPASLGHEFVGEIVDVGPAVDGFAIGDVVTSDLNYRCGSCDQCQARRSHLCRNGRAGLFTNYAFATCADLEASYLLRLDRCPRMHLALSEPLSCVLHALRWAAIQGGDRVLVVGAGGLGLCMAFALCARSLSFEIAERMPSRRALISASVGSTARAVASPVGEYDVVFDLSGTEAGLRSACEHVKSGGRLCSMSHLDHASDGGFLLAALTRRDVVFKVSYLNGERENLEEAADLLQRRWDASWDPTIEVIALDQLERTIAGRRASRACKAIIQIGDQGTS